MLSLILCVCVKVKEVKAAEANVIAESKVHDKQKLELEEQVR